MEYLIEYAVILVAFFIIPIGYSMWFFYRKETYDVFVPTATSSEKIQYRRHKKTGAWEQKVGKVILVFLEDNTCIKMYVTRKRWEYISGNTVRVIKESNENTKS